MVKIFGLVLSPAIGMTLYGPNWNGVYWEQNTTQGTDSLAAIIDAANPTLTKVFRIIFIVSGKKKAFEPKLIFARVTNYLISGVVCSQEVFNSLLVLT